MPEERLWCTACGTVTRDMICDCNRYGRDDYKPNFVNYADALLDIYRKQVEKTDRLLKALEKIRSYNVDIAAGRINYCPHDHIQVIDEALASDQDTD